MLTDKILVVWSNYYKDLANKQLDSCLSLLNQLEYEVAVEVVEAGAYEIPAVIQYYHRNNPYAGYLPLSLLLKGSTDHYEFIWEHIKECFIRFAMDGIFMGNGIITAPNMEILISRVKNQERVREAVNALDYLIKLKNKFKK